MEAGRKEKIRGAEVGLICRGFAAGYLTPAIVHYLHAVNLPLPQDQAAAFGAVGFLIGVSAMWISDFVIDALARRLRPGG
ncbi:hypothetical protein [Mycoplana sp. MJR14]|uniref:hypothetical protein n=1 Tax=Mycoplana sp. MJR14 TaxID=3032583 RepID=UPI0023DBE693|nr:hypothetical protein [Mycoplana sp. MJR14]MDF1634910.1 hypothetical protein [Mycoplana sp. MJR14]